MGSGRGEVSDAHELAKAGLMLGCGLLSWVGGLVGMVAIVVLTLRWFGVLP